MSLHTLTLQAQHHLTLVLIALFVLIVLLLAARLVSRRRPRKLDPEKFRERWVELQRLLADRKTWPMAIVEADKLLDEALRRRRFRGKTMGERLVSAQRQLTANDTVWFGHKLCNKLLQEEYKVTHKAEVKNALLGYLQALKDLGALRNDKQ